MAFVNDDFWGKLIVAGVAALLAFLSSYVFWYLSKQREERKQLSYDLNQQLALPAAAGSLAEPVSVKYDQTEVSNLYFVTLFVENTGNRLVQNQRIRMNIKGARLLKWILDPLPEPEFGVVTEGGEDGSDLVLIIGHLERQHTVTLKMALSAAESPNIRLIPHNEQGGVEFIPRSIKTRDDELAPISRALAIAAAALVLPGIVQPLPGGEYIALTLQLALIIFLLPYAPKFIRAIALHITTRDKAQGIPTNHGLWVSDGSVHVDYMTIGPSSNITKNPTTGSNRIHPGIILLRDAIMRHLEISPEFSHIIKQLANASREIQSPKPDNSRIQDLLEEIQGKFAGSPQEQYVSGIVATMLMEFASLK
ncbi:hypothetical protein [Streptosporangium longisporum]|uniref:Flagellar protein FliL n=1 Tax=Streptosporangium longisporum TaxID=46187 RepID=A0ABN3XTU9_9ACTN